MHAHEESFRRLALQDEQCIQSLLGIPLNDHKTAGLDSRAHALVRLAALIALGASDPTVGPRTQPWGRARPPTRSWATLIAVAPITGLAQVVAATPAVARSLGYDLDWAFEALDSDPCD